MIPLIQSDEVRNSALAVVSPTGLRRLSFRVRVRLLKVLVQRHIERCLEVLAVLDRIVLRFRAAPDVSGFAFLGLRQSGFEFGYSPLVRHEHVHHGGLVRVGAEGVDLAVGDGDSGVLQPRRGLLQERGSLDGGLLGGSAEPSAREQVRVLSVERLVVHGADDLPHLSHLVGRHLAHPLPDGFEVPFGVGKLRRQYL